MKNLVFKASLLQDEKFSIHSSTQMSTLQPCEVIISVKHINSRYAGPSFGW